jgi:hypothetical protein
MLSLLLLLCAQVFFTSWLGEWKVTGLAWQLSERTAQCTAQRTVWGSGRATEGQSIAKVSPGRISRVT